MDTSFSVPIQEPVSKEIAVSTTGSSAATDKAVLSANYGLSVYYWVNMLGVDSLVDPPIIDAWKNPFRIIEEKYSVRLSPDVQRFLISHPAVADVLREAFPYLVRHFGQDFELAFELDRYDGGKKLWAYVVTGYEVEEALDRLDNFDRAWFNNYYAQLDLSFNFHLGYK